MRRGGRHSWDGLAHDLSAAGFHVLTFDNRGAGESERGRPSAAMTQISKTPKTYDGATHGVSLFVKDRELRPAIVKWLQGVMK